MESLDASVLRTLHMWRSSGLQALLATVVRTWGSSPRPVGSIMAISKSGAIVGSVSGGCIEDDLFARYMRGDLANQSSRGPAFVKYGVRADEAHRFGLPCGGTVEVFIEPDPDAGALDRLVCQIEAGRLVRRTVATAGGQVSLMETDTPEELRVEDEAVVNTFGPEYRMLLIGAGQLTEYLATMALFNGFSVTVCDPREEYRGAWSVSGAKVLGDMPDDVVKAFRPDQRSCIVALTHDPKLDDLALLEALSTSAFYIGAIGSRRNNTLRHDRMAEHFGATPSELSRLRGPVGIYIGSKTPAEIAVSIMAEILAVKNGIEVPPTMQVANAKAHENVRANAADLCRID
jgi:xanthine dehydrogenase accessory factor